MRLPARRVWIALVVVVALALALVQVTVTGPRIGVRWSPAITDAERIQREERYSLRDGQQGDGPEWRYELHDWSRDNVAALVRDRAVADTAYIDRETLTAEEGEVRVGIRPLPFPLSADERFRDPLQLFQVQTLWLLLAAAALFRAARVDDPRRRRLLGVAIILGLGAAAFAYPIPASLIRTGDADTYTVSRTAFEKYTGVTHVRFEAHLSYALLGRLYGWFGTAPDAPDRALDLLMRLATLWFVTSALLVGFVERWSPQVLRYLALAVIAPVTLLYFGYRELGYLSLNVAAFPLVARGLQAGGSRLEGGGLLVGLGAALHGFGLLSLSGAALGAIAGVRDRIPDRIAKALRVIAWAVAAYVAWIAIYVIAWNLPVTPGHAEAIPWRPLFVDRVVTEGEVRVNAAILSLAGARDLLFTAWVVGVPLLALVIAARREHGDAVRLALWYSVPSAMFLVAFWPIQGLGMEMDLVFAAFPAFYALAWVSALDARRSRWAAAFLVSAHLAFWRIVLDARFVN